MDGPLLECLSPSAESVSWSLFPTLTTLKPKMAASDAMERDFVMDPDGDTVIVLNNPTPPVPVNISRERQAARTAVADSDVDMNTASELNGPTSHTFLVSSRHLILASPVFKSMLTKSGWREGKKVDGQFRIDTSEWDSQAFCIVLNLVHGRQRQTPTSV